ncbi:hypothetical protein JCM16161A_04480 [Vulcanisaeta sp. JCM 16161]|uniref:hypothetical protein n=1 Tax=Vulcanisaeta sp. JCM 16161 TaxID=1295372 RepID=UPI0006D0154A|nr:hypothetical protein [Vulcanisaeta sp. JCM 16161]
MKANKIGEKNKIIVQLVLKGLRGFREVIPDVFREFINEEEYKVLREDVLEPLRLGFSITDEGIHNGKPSMSTSRIWQLVLWCLLYPGEHYLRIDAININKGNVTIMWHLIALEYSSNKNVIFDMVKKLSKTQFLRFILTVLLGDGDVTFERRNVYVRPIVRLSVGINEFKEWSDVLNRLKNLEINWKQTNAKGEIQIQIRGKNAIKLARIIINAIPSLMIVLFDVLEVLGFDKWNRLKSVAGMR